MGIFTRKRTQAPSVPPMGSGRRLATDQPIEASLASLEEVVWSYREPQYPEMPAYFHAGWTWSSPDKPPDVVVCCFDHEDDFLLVTLWDAPDRPGIGIFPLGGGDDRLQGMPVIGHWKQRDRSLTSVGTIPHGSITLAAPAVPDGYAEELIGSKGFSPTERNVMTAWSVICEQFALKAVQFISSRDARAADRFIDACGPSGPAEAQRILDEFAAWDPAVLPYMQDIPPRIRALLLSMDDATLWQELTR